MAKILLINPDEKFSDPVLKRWILANPQHDLVLAEKNGLVETEAIAAHPDAEVLLCTYGNYSAQVLKGLPKLRAVIATTTAMEYVDLKYCQEKAIEFSNTRGYTGTAVAEHLLALLLALARKLALVTQMATEIANEQVLGTELMAKTLGILGYGHIGKQFARMAQALGMKVLVYNRSLVNSPEVQQVALAELLARAEILACVLPLNAETHHLMNPERLALLPRGALVVSTSPEEIFDLPSISSLLSSGALGGVGLDLHSPHPELYKLPNFIATRTKAWYTKECVERRTQSFLGTLDKLLTKQQLHGTPFPNKILR